VSPEFQSLHVLYLVNRFSLGVNQTGTVGVQIHHLGVAQLFGLELVVDGVDYLCGHRAAGISQGQVNGRHHRKTSPGVGQD